MRHMNQLSGLFISLYALPLLLLFSQTQPATGADDTITIGVLSHRHKPETEAGFQPMVKHLNRNLPNHKIRLEAFSFPELEAALATNRLGFVITNPGHYIQMRHKNRMSGVLATVIERENGYPCVSFGGVIITRSDRTDINHLKDLKGKRIATVSTASLGGYQAQAYELLQSGVRLSNDASLIVTGMPHDLTVQALLAGKADVALLRTATLETMIKSGKLDRHKIKIINQQLLPGYPFASSTRL